jgi:glycosyltransferase involved in cell wall biosynthesis
MSARGFGPIPIVFDLSPHTLGGTERFLARLLPTLDARRFTPIVIARKDAAPLRFMAAQGIRTVVIDRYESQRGIRSLAGWLRRERVGVAQSNYYSFGLGLAANLAGVPHVWRPGGHVEWGSGVRTARDARLALQAIDMLSAAVVCNSRFVRRQFPQARRRYVLVIPNGVSLPPNSLPMLRDGVLRIGMVAHMSPQKRHVDFIEAALRVAAVRRDVVFSMYGRAMSGADSRVYAHHLRRKAAPLIASGRMVMSDFSAGADPHQSVLDILVLPSIGESFSNALIEAMVAGRPVIAARSGGNPEIVDHGVTGLLVPPRSPADLSRAMLDLIDRPARRRSMGRAARASVIARFGMKACVSAYSRLYAQLTTGRDRENRSSAAPRSR